ncbi:MAG: 50S ribosomal protein L30 [Magnetococcales bacterium]|nr:50S ribosomal protein L30 [Magnetococcales bacterium]
MSENQTITVRLIRSPIGRQKKQQDTLRAMGLTRLQMERNYPDNAAMRGMVARVKHLVEVIES